MAVYEITNIPGDIDFECSGDYTRRIVQNAKNLLMCRMGEIPYDRQRGFDQTLYDLPFEEMRQRLMPELDRVMLWEPDVEVVAARADIENGQTIIRCAIKTADE